MVVVALNGRCGFLEADVVESSERCTADVLDRVVWDEELLLEMRRPIANEACVKQMKRKVKRSENIRRALTFHLMKM